MKGLVITKPVPIGVSRSALDIRTALGAALGAALLTLSSGGAGSALADLAASVTEGGSAAEVPASASGSAALQSAERAGIDIGAVIETVRHHISAAPDRPGVLVSNDALYRAEFSAAGFALTLRQKTPPSVAGRPDQAFRVSVTGLRRGATGAPLATSAWRGEQNRAERSLAAGVDERVTARDGSVEWDVVLSSKPPGRGDFLVDARLNGAGTPKRVGAAWRFPVGDGRTVRVGQLIVKDALGNTLYRALPRARPDSLSLVVPESVLEAARYPLTLDPTISAEYPASDPSYQPAPSDQTAIALAHGGTSYLVAWQDGRSGAGLDVLAARLDGSGNVLDPAGVIVADASGDQKAPAIAWNGTNFLVAWQDARSGVSDIYGARVSPAGSVLDANDGFAISAATASQAAPTATAIGGTFFVSWEDGRSGSSLDVYGARVSSAGAVLDAAGIGLATGASEQSAPAAASDGTNALVVWQHGTDIRGGRVSSGGAPLDGSGAVISSATGDQTAPALAWNGTSYLAAWRDTRNGEADIYAARVSPTAAVLDGSGIAVSTAASAQERPAVGRNGTNFLVAWDDLRTGIDRNVYGARVDGSGTVLDANGLPLATLAGDEINPSVTSDGTNFLIGYEGPPDATFGWDAYAALVDGAGEFLRSSSILISTMAHVQSVPSIAWNGTTFLIVWQDASTEAQDIFAARVTASGSILDGAGIIVCECDNNQSNPKATSLGSDFFMVWTDRRAGNDDVFGARITDGGSLLDIDGFAIKNGPSGHGPAAVTANGTDYLVTWAQAAAPAGVYARRVSAAGALLGSDIEISTAGSGFAHPAASAQGTEFLAVWSARPAGKTDTDVFARRVSASGSVVGTTIGVSTAGGDQAASSVASDGTNHLVVWEDSRGADREIFGARVDGSGNVLDGTGFAITPTNSTQNAATPGLAWDGATFLAAWRDFRADGGGDIYGTRVSSAGQVLDGAGFAIAASTAAEAAPAVTRSATGLAGVTYTRAAAGPIYGGADTVFLRTVGDTPPPQSICSRVGTTLKIFPPAGTTVTIGRTAAGSFNVTGGGNANPSCDSTVSNTDTVEVGGGGGVQTIVIDLSNGQFAPGATAEGTGSAEIEFEVDLGDDTDALVIKGGTSVQTLYLGTGGINLNNDDDADVTGGWDGTTVNAGAGNDKLYAIGTKGTGTAMTTGVSLNGEDGKDTLTGGLGEDVLNGGNGDDTFKEAKTPDGSDLLIGGPGVDRANYAARTAAISITLDDVENDGAAGEFDNVASDIEKADGGKGADTLDAGTASVGNTFIGGNGNDTILGRAGNDTLKGGNNNDTITGGTGNDALFGDKGDDNLNAQDGVSSNDSIDGGVHVSGDVCTADSGDTVINCNP